MRTLLASVFYKLESTRAVSAAQSVKDILQRTLESRD